MLGLTLQFGGACAGLAEAVADEFFASGKEFRLRKIGGVFLLRLVDFLGEFRDGFSFLYDNGIGENHGIAKVFFRDFGSAAFDHDGFARDTGID